MGQSIGMGAQIVGSEMQGWAALLEQQAMLEALQKQLKQQQGYQDIGYGSLMASLPEQGRATADKVLGQAATQRMGDYGSAPQLTPTTGTAQDKAAVSLAGQQRAGLGAYGDLSLQQSIGQGRTQDVLGRIASRAQGSAWVYPFQMDRAQHSQDLLAGIGQAISSLGGSGVNYQQLFGQRPTLGQQVNQAYPGGQGYGGVGVDGSSTMGNPYTNVG